MKLFAAWGKMLREKYDGKIYTRPNRWVFSDEGTVTGSGVYIPARASPENGGRMISLIKSRSAINCPVPPGDPQEFYKNDRGYSVPLSKCCKCPNRLPKLCCAELRRRAQECPVPLKEFATAITEASKKVKEIIE